MIIQNINGFQHEVPVMTLQPDLEQLLLNTLQMNEEQEAGFRDFL